MSLEERKKETFNRVLEGAGCRRRSEDPLGSSGLGSLQFLSVQGEIGVGGYDVQDCVQMVNNIEEICNRDEKIKDAFVQGMKEEFGDAEGLLAGISPATIVGVGNDCTETDGSGCWDSVAGDSLIRLLMLVKPIRNELALFLIERVPELEKESCNLHLAVLGQFRWLEVYGGLETRDIVSKMVEILPKVGYDSQKQIAVVLSEIVDVESQEAVIDALYQVLCLNQEFLIPMLECVSAMDLSRDQILKLDGYLFGLLTDVWADKVPLIIEHLLFTCATASCEDLERRLKAIKRDISFDSQTIKRIKMREISAQEQIEHKDIGRRIFGVLCHGMPCRADLCCNAIQYLNSLITSGEDLATLEFWLSLSIPCHFWGGRHNKIKFYKDVLKARKSCVVFREGIQGHVKTIHAKLNVLSDLVFHLMKQKNVLYRECGIELLGLLLQECSKATMWDDVNSMLQLIFESLTSSSREEWCAALQACANLVNLPTILSKICEKMTLGLLECIVLLKDSPEIDQTFVRRKAILDVVLDWGVVASKSVESSQVIENLESNIVSFLESQLFSWNADSQVLGSAGIVRLIVKLGNSDEGVEKVGLSGHAKALLLTGLESRAKTPELFNIICDEVSAEVDHMPHDLRRLIVQKLSDQLETQFIVHIDQLGSGCRNRGTSDLQIVPWWNLNGEMKDVVLSLTPYDMFTFRKLWTLFPLFKLVCNLNWSLHADLSQIDALLGLQVGLPSKSLACETEFQCLSDEDQKRYLLSLILALGWFRELFSGFGRAIEVGLSNESDTLSKLMGIMLCSRLSEALQLEAVLEKNLSSSTSKFTLAGLLSKGSATKRRATEMVGARKRSRTSLKENTESLNSQSQAGEKNKQYGYDGCMVQDDRQEVLFPSLLSAQDMSSLRSVSPCCCTSFFGMFDNNKLPILFSTIPSAYYVSREFVSILNSEEKLEMKQRVSLMNQFAKFVPTVRRLMEKAMDILLVSELQEDDMLKKDMDNIVELIPEEALASMPEYLDRIDNSPVARSCNSPRNCAIPLLNLLSLLLLKALKAYEVLFNSEEYLRQVLRPFSSVDTPLHALIAGAFEWLAKLDSAWTTSVGSKTIAINLSTSVQSLYLSFRCKTVKILCILSELRLQSDSQESGKDFNVSDMQSKINSIADSLLQMQGPFMPALWPKDLKEDLGDLVAVLSGGIGKGITVTDDTNTAMLTLRPVHFATIGRTECHDKYKSLTSTTLEIWYKSTWRVLINKWTKLMHAISRSKSVSESDGGLDGFNSCCEAFHKTVSIVKIHSSNDRILIESIKSAIIFLDQFVKAVPSVPQRLLASKESLRSIKEVQKSIRVLHSVCAQAKIKANMQLTNCIPKFKKCVERFVIEMVKLLKSEALEVELGELKHRDLQGNALQSSQLFPSQA